jgi:hypothetical protein
MQAAIEHLASADEPALTRFAGALADWWASGDGVSLEQAIGMPPNWRSSRRKRGRDAAVLRIAAYFPDLRGRPLAERVDLAIGRYRAAGWKRDERAHRRPDGPSGEIFDLLRLGTPPSFETIRKIIDIAG